jgi:CheY-like chemotaxis protein
MSDHKQEVLQKLHESERFDGKKILLVDDDNRNLIVLLDVLEEKGFTVIEAENGLVALDQLKNHPDVDLVLMDIMMPEMDGYEATREIRKNPKWRDLPILALTAKAMSTDRAKCIEAGANDYLTKPIDIPRLFSLIRAWIRSR